MKRNFIKTIITSLLLPVCIAISVISTSIFVAVKAGYNYDPDTYNLITYTDAHSQSITLKCYEITGSIGVTNPVAVAWGGANTISPSVFSIPEQLDKPSGGKYNVVAIAKHGFKGVTMDQIELPTSILEIQEEAFAYCKNLTEFTIPYNLTEIVTGTFMNCTKLAHVYFADSTGAKQFGNETLTKIGDHAFESCTSLAEFYCPKLVTYFGEACFQRCTSIVNFYFPSSGHWVEEEGQNVWKLTKVQNEIENFITVRPYAFAECTSLIFCYFETNMKEIDNYAFAGQNGGNTMQFYYTGNSIPVFTRTLGDTNGNGVEDEGETITVETQYHWRNENIAYNLADDDHRYDININNDYIYTDNTFFCLRYSTSTSSRKLDCRKDDSSCSVYVIGDAEHSTVGEYAIIESFVAPAPGVNVPGCYVKNGNNDYTLTIPSKLNNLPVKVIGSSAFAGRTEIKTINFGNNLVQICNQAFTGCTGIKNLNFGNANSLKEISYSAFSNAATKVDSNTNFNANVESIALPDSVEYLGDCAFAGFVKVKSLSLGNGLKVIGDAAFLNLGKQAKQADGKTAFTNMTLTLPKSLNDAAAKAACIKHTMNHSYKHTKYDVFCAIGKYAFDGANVLGQVIMENDDDNVNNASYTTSMYSNAFVRCENLYRFETNYNLAIVGKDAFKGSTNLRELFLSAKKTYPSSLATQTIKYQWSCDEDNLGTYGGTLFTGSSPDLVIYVNGSSAPTELSDSNTDNDDAAKLAPWNAETFLSYTSDLGENTAENNNNRNGFSRASIPTFYNIDYKATGGITYWNPKTNSIQASKPTQLSNYTDGTYASVVRVTLDTEPVTYEYTFARYYCDGSHGTSVVDLTKISGISDYGLENGTNKKLTVVGDESFATKNTYGSSGTTQGLYFILPDTIETIGERAFFRRTATGADYNASYGTRIITYRSSSGANSGKIVKSNGTEFYDDGEGAKDSAFTADLATARYCVLPSGTTKIKKNAFYNHTFTSINIPASIDFIGNGAFYVNPAASNQVTTDSITIGSNNYFKVDSTAKGVYYNPGNDNAKKTLIYQYGTSGGALTIAADTKAIGFHAAANSTYSSVNLNGTTGSNGVKVIYGGGFQNNKSLRKVTGVKSLRYIGSMKNASAPYYTSLRDSWNDADYDEIWDSTMNSHFDNTDYRDYAYKNRAIYESLYGAFKGCTNLEEIDFVSMGSSIRKIGAAAFEGDSKLYKMTDSSKTYTYYTYSKTGGLSAATTYTQGVNSTNGVMDLTYNTNLRSIGKAAFAGCTSIKYIHLPVTESDHSKESHFYVGMDPEIVYYSGGYKSKSYTGYAKILNDNQGTAVLVGEVIKQANQKLAGHKSADKHYPNGCFGSKNNVYYYVDPGTSLSTGYSSSDVQATDIATTTDLDGGWAKYWTTYNGCYIIFNDIDSVIDWFVDSHYTTYGASITDPNAVNP